MVLSCAVQKVGDALMPCTEADKQILAPIKQGKGFRVELVQMSARAIENHRLYFGGLVRLVADYWEPEDGLISKYDKKVMGKLIDWVANKGEDTDALYNLVNLYLQDRADEIKAALPEYEKAAASLQSIHDWLKEEAGFYDAVLTPTGVRKEVHSISFNAMPDEEEFKLFYKKVFNVAWRYVFSRANFKNQEEAENLAIRMSKMSR